MRWVVLGTGLLLGSLSGIGPGALAHAAPPDSLSARTASAQDLSAHAIAFTLRYSRMPVPHASPLQPRDRWLAMDKAKHVGGSLLWTLSTQYVLVAKADLSEPHALPWSVVSGAAVGLAKEAYDARYGPTRTFGRKDLVADAVGIALAVGVIAL